MLSLRALNLIISERNRQLSDEKFTYERDDQYFDGELSLAGYAYMVRAEGPDEVQNDAKDIPICWPDSWDEKWWKPTTRLRNLEKAGALFQADIDRLFRLRSRTEALISQELAKLEKESTA